MASTVPIVEEPVLPPAEALAMVSAESKECCCCRRMMVAVVQELVKKEKKNRKAYEGEAAQRRGEDTSTCRRRGQGLMGNCMP
jgi:hypothetical protein